MNSRWNRFTAFCTGFSFGMIPYNTLAIILNWQDGPVIATIRRFIGL